MICLVARSYSKKRERNGAPAISGGAHLWLTVRPRPGRPSEGLLNVAGTVFPCAIGRGGTTIRKREGDGATPLTTMRLLSAYVVGRRFPLSGRLVTRRIAPDLGWCEVPDDRNYNRPVRMPYAASHERMLREDGLYDACIVLDWNIRPRRRGCGSAIFFHLARPGYTPTQGCVAVSCAVMRRLLPLLSSRTRLRVSR